MKTILLGLSLMLPAVAGAFQLGDIYPDDVLRHWQERYRDNIQWNFDVLVLGKLTPAERARVGRVRLAMPLRGEGDLRNHPLQFYATPDTVTVPVLSVKFFDDLALAWAYLWANGLPLEPVADYVAMLRYRDPADMPGGRFPDPLAAMAIPADAWKTDAKVDDVSQKALKSAIVWVLAHELGHIYHRDPGYGPGVARAEARANEVEADRFANTIMRRVGVAPLGMVQFFMAQALLDRGRGDFASAEAYAQYLATATHPLSADRLEAVADDLLRAPEDFTAEEPDPAAAVARIRGVAEEIRTIGSLLGDPGMHRLVVATALATDPGSLKSRDPRFQPLKAGRLCPSAAGAGGFEGDYRGVYTRRLPAGVVEALGGRMSLARDGNRVAGRFSFGAGEGRIQGYVLEGRRLQYDWTWGDAGGRGQLELRGDGSLTGGWGLGDATEGAGNWDLCRT